MARHVSHAERERAEWKPLDEWIRIAVRVNQFTAEDALAEFRQAAAVGRAWPWQWDPPREPNCSPPPALPRDRDNSQPPAPRKTPWPLDPVPIFAPPASSNPIFNEAPRRWPPRGSLRNPEQHWFNIRINADTVEVFDDFGMSKSQARSHAKWRRLLIHSSAELLRIWGVTDLALSQETGEPATLREAADEKVHQVITDIYNEAETAQSKPPNKKELVMPVRARLRAVGYTKSGRRIMHLAGDPRHEGRRWKPGETVGSKKVE